MLQYNIPSFLQSLRGGKASGGNGKPQTRMDAAFPASIGHQPAWMRRVAWHAARAPIHAPGGVYRIRLGPDQVDRMRPARAVVAVVAGLGAVVALDDGEADRGQAGVAEQCAA